MARKRKPDRVDDMLAELVKGKSPDEILGENGILKELTKRLVESALEGEMTDHLGYEPRAVEGRNTGNSRNGKTGKTIQTVPTGSQVMNSPEKSGRSCPPYRAHAPAATGDIVETADFGLRDPLTPNREKARNSKSYGP